MDRGNTPDSMDYDTLKVPIGEQLLKNPWQYISTNVRMLARQIEYDIKSGPKCMPRDERTLKGIF